MKKQKGIGSNSNFYLERLSLFLSLFVGFVFIVRGQTDSLDKVLKTNLSVEQRVDALNQRALMTLTDNPEQSLPYLQEAKKLAGDHSYHKGLGESNLLLANAGEEYNSPDTLKSLYDQAVVAFEKAGLFEKQAQVYNQLGILYERMGSYSYAIKMYYKSLFIFQSLDNKKAQANELNNIGLIYQVQKQYRGAQYYFKRAISIGESLKDADVLANGFNNLAICYLEQGNPKMALTYFNKVLAIDIAQQIPANLASTYNNLGATEVGLENYVLAKEFYLKAIDIKARLRAYSGLGNSYGNLGGVYAKLKQYDSASYYLNKAIDRAQDDKAFPTILEVYKEFSKMHEAKGDMLSALKWEKKYSQLNDSLNDAEASLKLAQFERDYGQILEYKSSSKDEIAKQEKNFNLKLLLFASFIGLLGIVFLVFYLLRVKRVNKDLQLKQKKIEVQNKILQVKSLEVLQAKEVAEDAANSKSQFISTISHEIRTPLNAIIGVTNLLQLGNPNPDQMENLNILKISSDNLLSLVNNLLDFSKLEAGKMQMESIDFNLRNLANDVKELFTIKAQEKGIELLLSVDEKLPNVIKGDPLRINQLLINLVNNAIKFTESGFVKIEINLQLATINHVLVYFSISDSGIGIPQNKQALIFNSFTQAEANTTRKYGGTGLGLSICKRILENLNSKLQLQSQIGKGSNFFFTINFEVSRNSSVGKSAKTASFEDSIKGKRVLIVEDNMMNVMVLRQFLERWGVKADVALNGLEGLRAIEGAYYDAILMDIHMPEMDGIEASLKIRSMEDERKRNVPIIALTAENEMQMRQRVYEVGMNDYIFKPFNPEDLKERLGYVLYNNEQLFKK